MFVIDFCAFGVGLVSPFMGGPIVDATSPTVLRVTGVIEQAVAHIGWQMGCGFSVLREEIEK